MGDRDAIAALWHESWHDAHHDLVPKSILPTRTLARFRDRISGLIGDSLVAVCTGIVPADTIGGFVTVLGEEVDQLFVARGQRGTGCAAHLLRAGEDLLRTRGISTAMIQCAAGNQRALAFYKKHGYVDTGLQDLPLWTPPDAPTKNFATHILTKRLG